MRPNQTMSPVRLLRASVGCCATDLALCCRPPQVGRNMAVGSLSARPLSFATDRAALGKTPGQAVGADGLSRDLAVVGLEGAIVRAFQLLFVDAFFIGSVLNICATG